MRVWCPSADDTYLSIWIGIYRHTRIWENMNIRVHEYIHEIMVHLYRWHVPVHTDGCTGKCMFEYMRIWRYAYIGHIGDNLALLLMAHTSSYGWVFMSVWVYNMNIWVHEYIYPSVWWPSADGTYLFIQMGVYVHECMSMYHECLVHGFIYPSVLYPLADGTYQVTRIGVYVYECMTWVQISIWL